MNILSFHAPQSSLRAMDLKALLSAIVLVYTNRFNPEGARFSVFVQCLLDGFCGLVEKCCQVACDMFRSAIRIIGTVSLGSPQA